MTLGEFKEQTKHLPDDTPVFFYEGGGNGVLTPLPQVLSYEACYFFNHKDGIWEYALWTYHTDRPKIKAVIL